MSLGTTCTRSTQDKRYNNRDVNQFLHLTSNAEKVFHATGQLHIQLSARMGLPNHCSSWIKVHTAESNAFEFSTVMSSTLFGTVTFTAPIEFPPLDIPGLEIDRFRGVGYSTARYLGINRLENDSSVRVHHRAIVLLGGYFFDIS